MRRLVCMIAFVGKSAGQAYVWRVGRVPRTVPIGWRLSGETRSGTLPA